MEFEPQNECVIDMGSCVEILPNNMLTTTHLLRMHHGSGTASQNTVTCNNNSDTKSKKFQNPDTIPTTRRIKNIVMELCCSTSGGSGFSSIGGTVVGRISVVVAGDGVVTSMSEPVAVEFPPL